MASHQFQAPGGISANDQHNTTMQRLEGFPMGERGTSKGLDPGATPRLESILRQLYAVLSLCIPIYLLIIFMPAGVGFSLFLLPIGLLVTAIFSSTMIMLTFRDRARLHPNSIKAAPTIPVLCRLPSIISCFVIALIWIATMGLTIFVLVVATSSSYYDSRRRINVGAGVIVASIDMVFVAAQIGLLLSIGIIGARERAAIKKQRRVSISTMA